MHATPSFGKPRIDRSLCDPAEQDTLLPFETSDDSERSGEGVIYPMDGRSESTVEWWVGGWMDRMVHALLPTITFFSPPLLCYLLGAKKRFCLDESAPLSWLA